MSAYTKHAKETTCTCFTKETFCTHMSAYTKHAKETTHTCMHKHRSMQQSCAQLDAAQYAAYMRTYIGTYTQKRVNINYT